MLRLIVWAGFVVVLGAGLPGHMSFDSIVQLYEGRMGVSESIHPPLMSWLLGFFDALVPGTGLYVAFNALLLFAGLYCLTRLQDRVSWLSVPVALALLLTPQIVIYQAIVWKDVLFANLAVTGFVCLACGVRRWGESAARLPALAAAILLFAFASLARQNGLLVLLAGALALGVVAGRGSLRRSAAYAGGALGAGVLLVLLTSAVLGKALPRDEQFGASGAGVGLRILQHYDIVGVAAQDPQAQFHVLEAAAPDLDDKIRTHLPTAYSPLRVDTFSRAPEMSAALWAAPAEAISGQWRAVITGHTGAYLRHRWDSFRWVMFTPDLPRCLPVWVGVSGPADKIQALGLREGNEAQDVALYNYATHFFRTPVYSHLTYALIAAAISVVLSLRRRPTDIVMAALLLSALAFAASFFLISLSCDYRYIYFLDLAAMVGLFYWATDPRLGRRVRPAHEPAAGA